MYSSCCIDSMGIEIDDIKRCVCSKNILFYWVPILIFILITIGSIFIVTELTHRNLKMVNELTHRDLKMNSPIFTNSTITFEKLIIYSYITGLFFFVWLSLFIGVTIYYIYGNVKMKK